MGKTPKKAAPGGDERNLYVRRLKATSTLSSEGCDTNLTVRQRESDNSNRVKPIGVQKRLPVPVAKVFKSKLRSPAKTKCHKALKTPTRFQPGASKDEKKLTSTAAAVKPEDIEPTKMYTETEESAVELKVSISKKDEKNAVIEKPTKDADETCPSHSTSNGKDKNEMVEPEEARTQDHSSKESHENLNVGKSSTDESSVAELNNGDQSFETITIDDETDKIDRANSESEECSVKLIYEQESQKSSEENVESQECTTNGQSDDSIEDAKEIPADIEAGKKTDNYSDEVVESTTSEASDSGNVTQSDKEGETTEQAKDNVNDPSFVSYDSSIMLKDVQIKLNDCLKENSKLFDVSNAEESGSADQQKRMDMSFGKTLRNISGRSTINRLKYVTVREHRFSPNSSLFVNTSSASLNDLDESINCKLARYPTDISDSIICNGSPADRKRKIAENAAASAKKLKTDNSGFLNTSFEMIKSIRRPVQVSTPNTQGYKFQTDKYSPKSFGDDKLTIDADVEPKKWCVVM